MSITEAQRKKDAHAGPGNSFPLDADHLRAAWDLAGHAADPDKVRAHVLAWAKAHGMMDKLPMSAQEHIKKAAQTTLAKKLLNMSWQHENSEGDSPQKRKLVMWAQQNGLVNALPTDAHSFMHDYGLPHDHGDGKEKHEHTVVKSQAVVTKAHMVSGFFTVAKAWDVNGVTHFESWVSTEHKDLDKDIVPPECFKGAIDGYARCYMPLSSEHNMQRLPVGHMQHVALVRDGQIFKAAKHPSDPADFEHFPGSGTGVYGLGVINTPSEAHAVAKGNLGGMSWIGRLKQYQNLPDGGKRYEIVDPWVECTLAAYPVNPNAVVLAAKAFLASLENED